MTVTLHPDNERMEIRIEGPLTIMEAAEARDQLALGLATAHGPVDVILAAITEIDTAGLQLLLALAKAPGEPSLCEPSAAVAERIERFGLRTALRIEGPCHGS